MKVKMTHDGTDRHFKNKAEFFKALSEMTEIEPKALYNMLTDTPLSFKLETVSGIYQITYELEAGDRVRAWDDDVPSKTTARYVAPFLGRHIVTYEFDAFTTRDYAEVVLFDNIEYIDTSTKYKYTPTGIIGTVDESGFWVKYEVSSGDVVSQNSIRIELVENTKDWVKI